MVASLWEKSENELKYYVKLVASYVVSHLLRGYFRHWVARFNGKSRKEPLLTQKKGNVQVAFITGSVRHLLLGERVALNLMARASGIATVSRKAREIADKAGWTGRVAGTRKTTPGFRLVEKYALLVGGVDTHRNDLSSMIMLKDNHIASAGSIRAAVKKARSVAGFSLKIEVECQNQQEAEEALSAGAEIAMLDNFKPDKLKEVSKNLKEKFPNALLEASGGVTLATLASYFSPNVDVISSSILHQGVPHIDFSLNILSAEYGKAKL